MLTWSQFKTTVDKIIEEKGFDNDTEIWYIDCSSGIGWGRDNPEIFVHERRFGDKTNLIIES